MKSLFPAFLKLDGRAVLVVGAGKIGEQKIEGLLSTGARITVVALQANERVQEWGRAGRLSLHQRAFQAADLDGMFLAIVATSSRDLNEFVYREAQGQRVLCNVVDVPEQCDFFYPAVVQRGDLQIAISTSGQSPSLAQRIRKQLEQQFGPNYASWVEELGRTRRLVLASDLPPEIKQELLHSLASREAFEERLRAMSYALRAGTNDAAVSDSELAALNSNKDVLEKAKAQRSEMIVAEEHLVARSSQLEALSSRLAAHSSEEIA
jgi:precorrin-2 dehydrogenase/sirohydrochlorin ferrochelatase